MKSWNQDTALQRLRRIRSRDYTELSEADTRAKFIDVMLIEVLGWQEEDLKREERCPETETYLDYKLSTNVPHLIIEAKKYSADFQLPKASSHREYKIGGVLSNSTTLIAALVQARDYAVSKGVAYCVATNGESYVFVRSQNQIGVQWIDHIAIVFRDLADIEEHFDLFCQLLSKQAVENGILPKALPVNRDCVDDESRFQTLDRTHLSTPRSLDRNALFPIFGEIVYRVFQDLSKEDSDSDILAHCYVESPRRSSVTAPPLDREAPKVVVTKTEAGDFQKRIQAALRAGRNLHSEVILLLGSVGVGKSTFIQRFRKVLAKDDIDRHGIWIYINFKGHSDTGEPLDNFINAQIEKTLAEDYADLRLFEWSFLKQVFHAEYERLRRGTLAPIFQADEKAFERQFALRVDTLMKENRREYLERTLRTASRQLGKSIFLSFDNADQLSPSTQNSIFLVAQRLSDSLKCYALLAMREESYWKNRESGPLNAFHTTAYQVQAPSIQQVLSKRFQYVRTLLAHMTDRTDLPVPIKDVQAVFERLVATLLGSDHRYLEFIKSTAAGDTRRALDTVSAFLISGHTNVDALLRDVRRSAPRNLTVPFHEFLNAIVLRDHETYSETHSEVLNIFNVSGSIDATNFNRSVVLFRLLAAKNQNSQLGVGYVPLEVVIQDCHRVGVLPETSLAILSIFAARRLIETETTIKERVEDSRFVRATISGEYYLEFLATRFEYLDLIVYNTPIGRDKPFRKMKKLATEITNLTGFDHTTRLTRVEKRVELIDEFVNYLTAEFALISERLDAKTFGADASKFLHTIRTSIDITKRDVLYNAQRVFAG